MAMCRRLVILIILIGMPLRLSAEPVPENAMKAAFLYNFALFTEWPTHLDAINLCISAESDLANAAAGVDGREVRDGIRMRVVHTVPGTDLSGCQILFVGEANRGRLHDILNRIGGSPVLTVTDVDGWLEQGVMIDMYKSEKRLAFDVNINASRRAGLVLSSKLLRLARRINE